MSGQGGLALRPTHKILRAETGPNQRKSWVSGLPPLYRGLKISRPPHPGFPLAAEGRLLEMNALPVHIESPRMNRLRLRSRRHLAWRSRAPAAHARAPRVRKSRQGSPQFASPAGARFRLISLPASPPGGLRNHLDVRDLAISTGFICVGHIISGGRPTELVDSSTSSFIGAVLGSFYGMFRRRRRSILPWMGPVGRSAGTVLVPWGVPAHAWRPQPSEIDNFRRRLLLDLKDMEKCRGSLELSQWRISAWKALIAYWTSSIPAGSHVQPVCRASVNSNAPGRRSSLELSAPLSSWMRPNAPRETKTSNWPSRSFRLESLG